MSTPNRTLDEIKKEYADTCAKAGEAHLMMKAQETTLRQHTEMLVKLHNEFNALEASMKTTTETKVS